MKKIMFFTWLLIGSLPILSPAQTKEKDNVLLLHTIGSSIKQSHFSQRSFDDAFAAKVFQIYMNWLDPNQVVFQEKDISALKEAGLKIDDELNGAAPKFYLEVASVFRKRVGESQAICRNIFSQPFQFEKQETWLAKPGIASYSKSDIDQQNKLSRWLKWQALERMNKMPLAEMDKQKAETKVRNILKQNMKKSFEEYSGYTDSTFFCHYLKSVLNAVDPHSIFLTQEEYAEWMGTLQGNNDVWCGLGVWLKEESGYVKVERIVVGGATEKSGLVAVDDIIVSIEQEDGKKENTAGHTISEIGNMFRGIEGSSVKLVLKKTATGTMRTVTIKRAVFNQEEEYTSSLLIDKGGKRIGYLRLPVFYGGGGRSAGRDLIKELQKLKEENASAIIIDLRDNPGGMLQGNMQVIGAFISKGPVVQEKYANGSVEATSDIDDKINYDGPLVVMVNSGTASAAELSSSALQDYKRALIIGTPSFGKGTAQSNVGIEQQFKNYNTGEVTSTKLDGELWLTQRKFYRISGKSVQLKGVTPDIVLPDYLAYQGNKRERDEFGTLPYDEIKPADYKVWNGLDLVHAKQKMQERVNHSPVFAKLKQNAALLNKLYNAPISLQWKTNSLVQKQMDGLLQECRTLSLLKNKLSVNILAFDESLFNSDPGMRRSQNILKSNIEQDIMIDMATDAALELAKQQVKK
jgi:carboxyl-terminal processing protease